jgi:hypothetical protein
MAGLTIPELKALIIAINALTHGQWRDTVGDKDATSLLKAQEKLCRAMIAKMGPVIP